MRSLNFNSLYMDPAKNPAKKPKMHMGNKQANEPEPQVRHPDTSITHHMWVCVNCWEVLLGHDTKMEHVNARHLLTSSIADSEPANTENFSKLCRIYGRINPEETHVVLFYVPLYVKEALKKGTAEMQHVKVSREHRENDLVAKLNRIRLRFD